MSWEDFVTRFMKEFVPVIEVQQLTRSYLVLERTTKTEAEITTKFRDRVLFFPQYAVMEEMTMTRYHDMFKTELWELKLETQQQKGSRIRFMYLQKQSRKLGLLTSG